MRPLDRLTRGTPLVHGALVLVQIFFASFSTAAKIALREIPAVGLAAVRVTVAALVFSLVWAITGRERVKAKDTLRCVVYAFFGIAANQLLFIAGLARTSATSAVVLGASIPVFTVGVALVMGRERATLLKLAGLALALAGALIQTGAGHFSGGGTALTGNLMILLNSLSYGVYLVESRGILARLRPLTVVTLTFVFGAVMIDLFAIGGGALGLVAFDPAGLLRIPSLRGETLAALAYVIACPTIGAYLLNTIALRTVPASLVAIYIYLQPILGALLAASILGERPGPATALAAAAIFAGIWLVNWDVRRRRAVTT